MKVSELIAKLAELPQDTEVVIFDVERNAYHADGDGTSEGVYPDIELEFVEMFHEESEKIENVVALSFISDYAGKENYILELEREKD